MKLAAFLGFAWFAVAACSSSDNNAQDASNDAIKHVDAYYGDGGYDAPLDAACGPVSVSSYQPTTMMPPNPPHAGACTQQQTSDYAQCQAEQDTTLCQQFADGQSGQGCRACIETQTTDPTWGVIVFQGSNNGTFNIEGCVDDALGDTSLEKASGGSGSCGDLLHASYGCQKAACAACTGDALDECADEARQGGCSAYDTAVESTTGACALLLGDAAPDDASACFPNTSISDPTQQELDWIVRMVGYMCGP